MFRKFLKGYLPSDNSDLVEVRPPVADASMSHFAIPETPYARASHSAQSRSGGTSLRSNIPKDKICFFGVGDRIEFEFGTLSSPLVYGTGASAHGKFDASLIDTTLPVLVDSSTKGDRLPYWPSYYDCSPSQRYQYLRWLASGRKDPNVELGFVFIYFYGLERRVLVDRADLLPIADELMRLLTLYGHSNSFRRYGSTLLWMAIYLASQSGALPVKELTSAIKSTKTWTDDTLGLCLSILQSKSILLPHRLARMIAGRDVRSSSSVIVSRHEEEFNKLFKVKYQERCGKGIQMDAGKRPKRIDYYPASGSLLRNLHSASFPEIPPRPDVLGKSAQFKPLIAIWEECIESLRMFSRAKKKADDVLTSDVYESLPPELRNGSHPEEEAWLNAWESNVDADDWPIIPVGELAKIKRIERRDRLTKTQCNRILTTADIIGFGVEPDARITGKNYRWDEKVTLFFHDGKLLDDPTRYAAASVLLRLGASIAEADGTVDVEELTFINEHLQGQFNLTEAESKRLDRLQYLLLHSRSGDNAISKTLAQKLPLTLRRLVGEFLVGVAASDEVICKAEMKALRAAYKSLELDPSELDRLVQQHTDAREANESEPEELHLDLDAVSKIMAETSQVATLLRDAMADGDDEIDDEHDRESSEDVAEADNENTADSDFAEKSEGFDGLDARYAPLLQAVLQQESWTPADFRTLADQHGLMLSGAVEAINEWSMDKCGDWLIEEGDPFVIHVNLLESFE